ncbi:holin [Nocardioides sp. J54]|uniref:holin n=1 Tax=Nocardioides sp. J54 TaxID=935866 RepID=UPI0006871F45|nr:holin [Nocardioides sp. J54]
MKTYARDLLDRAAKTAAQAAVLTLGADQVNALDADWRLVGGMAAGGFILSALTTIGQRGIFGRSE